MVWALQRIEKEKPAAGKTDYWRDFWRSGWDSNPRNLAVQLISSQSRYDHFDIAPCLFPPAILVVSKALKNPLERKAGEKAKKYSI